MNTELLNPSSKSRMPAEDTLTRAKRLDLATLAQIHDRYYSMVYRYVRYRLDDDLACEDITSEVFMRLLDALHKQGGPSKDLRGWLLGTASNLVNDHLRARYSRRTATLEDESGLSVDDNPEHSYEATWRNQEVRQAMMKLTPEQQHVLALRFVEEFSLEETANQMKKTVNAVKALQFRAIEALRRFLDIKL